MLFLRLERFVRDEREEKENRNNNAFTQYVFAWMDTSGNFGFFIYLGDM